MQCFKYLMILPGSRYRVAANDRIKEGNEVKKKQ